MNRLEQINYVNQSIRDHVQEEYSQYGEQLVEEIQDWNYLELLIVFQTQLFMKKNYYQMTVDSIEDSLTDESETQLRNDPVMEALVSKIYSLLEESLV